MSGYIKYFDDGGKNMSFEIEDKSIYSRYHEIWTKIKKALNIKFHSRSLYDDKYIKTIAKTCNGIINTLFSDQKNEIITLVLQQYVDKKNYPQAYLEQCKNKIKRRKMVDFIAVRVNLSSDGSDD